MKTGLNDNNLGKVFSDLFDKRISGDYDDFIDINENDVLGLIEPVKQLIDKIENILK